MNMAIFKNKMSILQDLNIPLWVKRPPKTIHLFFEDPILYARVLVILESKIPKSSDLYTTFQGMLKVLNLPLHSISVGWLLKERSFSELDLHNIINSFLYWKPEYILVLGKNLGDSLKTHFDRALENMGDTFTNDPSKDTSSADSLNRYFFTHHPETFMAEPELKRSAYNVLCLLKEDLHSNYSNNNDSNG